MDHAALQWLNETSEPIGQQARWLELLEEYGDYTFEHQAGTKPGNADALLQHPPDVPENHVNGQPVCLTAI